MIGYKLDLKGDGGRDCCFGSAQGDWHAVGIRAFKI